MKEFVMGNEAIALGAMDAGVHVVTGYPGTPSTEILETIAKRKDETIYVEWSVNEKAALEVAAGASYSGARTLVTMKQVGLNVASDPLMSLNYVGIEGGMVIVVADDPGPISSQTEQDTRHFAQFAKMMVFDPSSPQEAYEMIQDAYTYSETYQVPVLFRPTTRICHSYQSIERTGKQNRNPVTGFQKDSSRFVIFPKLSYQNHIKIEQKLKEIANEFTTCRFNKVEGTGTKGILTGGVSYEYVRETTDGADCKILKIATANPIPEKMLLEFLKSVDEVLVIEELDPVLEKAALETCGKYHLATKIYGKLTNHVAIAGELTNEFVKQYINQFIYHKVAQTEELGGVALPVRPPVLCAGCPHRASFYAVKKAMEGRKANFAGDIGCYTLGNAKPLDMVDTCLCMGADVTIAQGLKRMNPDTVNFAFIGDSTFFASGITGVVNAVYNQADMILVVLDNSTTAMTGHQPHPGTGITMMGDVSSKISIEKVLRAIGVNSVRIKNPFDLNDSIQAVKELADETGIRAIIFQSPCIAITKSNTSFIVDNERCIGCQKCIREIGCPALIRDGKKVAIEPSLCTGCGLCSQICSVHAIGGIKHE